MRVVYESIVAELKSFSHGSIGRIDAILKDETGLIPVYNAYWDFPMHLLGIYGGTYGEILHLFPQVSALHETQCHLKNDIATMTK